MRRADPTVRRKLNERILLIDDEPWVHDLLRAYLEREGYRDTRALASSRTASATRPRRRGRGVGGAQHDARQGRPRQSGSRGGRRSSLAERAHSAQLAAEVYQARDRRWTPSGLRQLRHVTRMGGYRLQLNDRAGRILLATAAPGVPATALVRSGAVTIGRIQVVPYGDSACTAQDRTLPNSLSGLHAADGVLCACPRHRRGPGPRPPGMAAEARTRRRPAHATARPGCTSLVWRRRRRDPIGRRCPQPARGDTAARRARPPRRHCRSRARVAHAAGSDRPTRPRGRAGEGARRPGREPCRDPLRASRCPLPRGARAQRDRRSGPTRP